MSTSSGITASQSLLDSYKNLEDGCLIVKVSDDNTELVPDHTVKGDLPHTFSELSKIHESQFPQPSYNILKNGDSHIFVSFIPDVAPIKQKMLYASSKNTLLQSLGGSFPQVFAWTELDELSHDHYKKQSKHTEGPLTEDEKVLRDINALQDLSFKKPLALMDGANILFALSPELKDKLASIGTGDVAVFNIDQEKELIELTTLFNGVTAGTLASKLALVADGPQYSLFGYGKGNAFVYACPSGSKVKDRMVYASFKVKLVEYLKSLGISVDKSYEVGDLDELELDVEPKEHKEEKRGFSKPKGPRRR